ncbi:MAG: alpha/beta hydrolase family protein [Myxococcota bacterium]
MKFSRWPREAWVPLAAGLLWLWHAPTHGLVGFLFSVIPGCLMVGSGISMLLMPGDRRIAEFASLGGALGVILALPAFFVVGLLHGLLLVAASVASFVAGGYHAVRLEPLVAGVPAPDGSLRLAAELAWDEALLATMQLTMPLPAPTDQGRVAAEVNEALELFEENGWLDKPTLYHRTPPDLEAPLLRTRKVRGTEYEHLSFESDFEPHAEEPGRERWLSYASNRVAHAWVVRHSDEPRPWLVCIHGYQMGSPLIDMSAFPPEYFHKRLGLNLLLPVLPLHGPRKIGRRSGDGFITGDAMDTVHAEAQAMWDIRRMIGWARAQGATSVGALGLSLGGYNTALLACLQEDLACAIPGIPLADFARAVSRHGPPIQLREFQDAGIAEDLVRRVQTVISPLTLKPLVPHEHRAIFGAVADRLVTPDQVHDLWKHWEEPKIAWYQGGHLTFRAHAPVRRLVRETLSNVGLDVG